VQRVLEMVEEKYGLRLPRKVVTVDYGCDVGDLFVRFRRVCGFVLRALRRSFLA